MTRHEDLPSSGASTTKRSSASNFAAAAGSGFSGQKSSQPVAPVVPAPCLTALVSGVALLSKVPVHSQLTAQSRVMDAGSKIQSAYFSHVHDPTNRCMAVGVPRGAPPMFGPAMTNVAAVRGNTLFCAHCMGVQSTAFNKPAVSTVYMAKILKTGDVEVRE